MEATSVVETATSEASRVEPTTTVETTTTATTMAASSAAVAACPSGVSQGDRCDAY
jgi:hypothetical protein